MDLYGRNAARNGSQSDRPPDWAPPGPETGLEESMRQLGLWGREFYPERIGVADCAYYMRTGSCGYGSKCRFNHPRDRSSVGGVVRIGEGEYPERVGEPVCQYYLKTGTCKFGASCKFHHPRHAGGSLSNVPLNIYGYPLRPDEKECSYYLKTGQCKFGMTCKFHHPQPAGVSEPVSAQPFYQTGVQSSLVPSAEQFGGASTGYRVARPPLLPGSYVPGAYGTMLLPPGVVPVQNWRPYSGPVSPALSPSAQPSVGAASLYGMTQLSSSAPAYGGPYSPLHPSAGLSSTSQVERVLFPVRPGQPECQYYMKTGDCKYGSTCKYHHPPDWATSLRNYALSSVGLPLRPGVQPCSFYLQNGHCKFGQTCRFDHPTGAIRYSSASASSPTDMPIAPPSYILGGYSSSLPTMGVGPSSSSSSSSIAFSELRSPLIAGSKRDPPHLSTSSSVGLMFPQTGAVSLSQVSPPPPPPPPLGGISRSTRQGEIRRSI